MLLLSLKMLRLYINYYLVDRTTIYQNLKTIVMNSNEILTADLIDILFEGKNKAYGAYDLRKTYNKRITIAVAGMVLICLIFSVSQLIAKNNDHVVMSLPIIDVNISDVDEPKPEKPKELLPPPAHEQAPAINTKQYTAPLITNVEEPDVPPVEDLNIARIGTENIVGADDDGSYTPLVEKSIAPSITPAKPDEDYDITFKKVEHEAKFPGGLEAWKKYLERNLNANIAADNGAPAGLYTVTLQFVVDRNGMISNIETVQVPKACPDCGSEAIRVIKKGPKWEPAIQNGNKVMYQAVQKITFQVVEN